MWRDSYHKPRFFGLDGRVFILMVVTLLHVTLRTLEILAVVAGVLAFIELWKGITPEVAYRMIRSTIAGRHRPAKMSDKNRRAVDYGFIEYELARQENRLQDSFGNKRMTGSQTVKPQPANRPQSAK